MLVVVENRNVATLLEFLFDFEAARSSNIFKVNAAEGTADLVNRVNDFVNVFCSNAKRESVNIAEFFEKYVTKGMRMTVSI